MKRSLAAGLAAMVAGLAGCQVAGQNGNPPSSPAPSSSFRPPLLAPTPVRLKQAAMAILDDAAVGLGRAAARDHLGAAEAAQEQPDQVAALDLFTSWGWDEASTRTWSAGDRRVDETLLITIRSLGAASAFEFWGAAADRPPLIAQPCPAGAAALDQCRYGSGSGRWLVVGRLDTAVFKISSIGVELASLAQTQTARLPAS